MHRYREVALGELCKDAGSCMRERQTARAPVCMCYTHTAASSLLAWAGTRAVAVFVRAVAVCLRACVLWLCVCRSGTQRKALVEVGERALAVALRQRLPAHAVVAAHHSRYHPNHPAHAPRCSAPARAMLPTLDTPKFLLPTACVSIQQVCFIAGHGLPVGDSPPSSQSSLSLPRAGRSSLE